MWNLVLAWCLRETSIQASWFLYSTDIFFPGDNLSKQKCVAFHQKVLVTPTTHQSEELCILTFIHSSWLTRYYLPKGRKEECIIIAYCFRLVCRGKKERKHCAMIIITELPLLVLVCSLVTLFSGFLWDILWIPRLQLGWWYTYFNTFGK